jgi:hypothetical protein
MVVECAEAESRGFSGPPLTFDFGDAFHSRGSPARDVIVCAVRSGTHHQMRGPSASIAGGTTGPGTPRVY